MCAGAFATAPACRTPRCAASSKDSVWTRTREPGIRITMPVNDAGDADRARIEPVIYGVWTLREHDSA